MEARKFSGKPRNTDVTEVLNGIKNAEDFEAQEAKENNISIKELQRRKKIELGMSGERGEYQKWEMGTKSVSIKEQKRTHRLRQWLLYVIPEELRGSRKIFDVFEKSSRDEKFQSLWNYDVFIPKSASSDERLINIVYHRILDLEMFSGIGLNSDEISLSRKVDFVKFQIREEIDSLERTAQNLLKGPFKTEGIPDINVLLYLKQKIIIEKLQKIISLLPE
jgi:hypothetical protein